MHGIPRARAVLLALALTPALGAAQEGLTVSGELRLRPELERPAAIDSLDSFTLLRARLAVQAELARNARIFLQIQDARTFGEEQSTTDASADRLDLHQGWLELVRPVGALEVGVRAGRQEINLGNERLVGAVNWSNTGRSFDAARLLLTAPKATWNVSALAATIRERGFRTAGQLVSERSDALLLGSYADTRFLDAWLLYDHAAEARIWRGIDRLTLGGRIDAPTSGPLTAWAEGSWQTGDQVVVAALEQPQDISAWMAGGRLAYARPHSIFRSIGVGLDYLSGDENPGDDEYSAFNVLYHTGHKWYGYMDLFLDPALRTGDRGLVDALASLTLALGRDAPLTLDVHRFWTAAQRAEEASDLGWELDLTLPLVIAPGQRLQLGYSAFRNGSAAPLAGLGAPDRWSHWAYAMVTFGFQQRLGQGN